MGKQYDVIIIGGGGVGSAVARELSRYRLSVALLEKERDVCCETSARNSGVLHAGYNNEPGSLMAKFCVAGNAGFDQVARELDIPYRRTGKLVVGFDSDDREALQALIETGERNGVPGLCMVDRRFIDEKAPCVGGEFAMWCPSTGVFNPFQFTLGLAENAIKNGVRYFLDHEVTGIARGEDAYNVTTVRGDYKGRWVINCAGLYADKISHMLGIHDYTIYPCRGEYFILDKRLGPLLPLPAYPVPNYKTGGLGIHLTPTTEGNILVGPSTEYLETANDYASTQRTMDLLIEDGSRIFPHLKREHFIRNYAGIRPKLTPKGVGGYHDFVIERRDDIAPRTVNLVGIESPGLTSALPIAREVVRLIREVEPLRENSHFDPIRKGITTFRDKSPAEQAALICQDPDYGEIVCRCETITKAEVRAALCSPLPPTTMAGVKYRCRTMMGRCQGGYCQLRVSELLMRELGCPPEALLHSRTGSRLFAGRVRT